MANVEPLKMNYQKTVLVDYRELAGRTDRRCHEVHSRGDGIYVDKSFPDRVRASERSLSRCL